MRASPRVLGAVAALGVGAFALSGCAILTDVSGAQVGKIGPISLTIAGCMSKQNSISCPFAGASGLFTAPTVQGQVLLAIALPSEVTPPSMFSADGGALVLAASPTYTAEIQRLAALAPGRRWFGYISNAHSFDVGSDWRATLQLDRAAGASGSPALSLLPYNVVLGGRSVDAARGLPDTRPVVCDEQLTGYQDETVCRDSRRSGTVTGLRDARLIAGPAVSTAAGTTATIPVTAKFAGTADPGVSFALTAATNLPDATPSLDSTTFTPGADSTTQLPLKVNVPASAAPGSYTVALTATLPGGESRSVNATLVVTSATAATTPATPPPSRPTATTPATPPPSRPTGTPPATPSLPLLYRTRTARLRRLAGVLDVYVGVRQEGNVQVTLQRRTGPTTYTTVYSHIHHLGKGQIGLSVVIGPSPRPPGYRLRAGVFRLVLKPVAPADPTGLSTIRMTPSVH